MLGTIANVILILAGGAAGLIFKNKLNKKTADALTAAMGLAVLVIGITGAIKSEDLLCMIVSLAAGTIAGELADIEKRLDSAGNALKKLFVRLSGKEESRFTEGFVSASLLYCVGAMAVMGSLEAGVNQNYTILISKGIIDCVISVTLAAAMGVGVLFSALTVGLYQGGLTLLAEWVAPFISQEALTEMSSAGGVVIIGIAVNMLGLTKERLRVGNMLPAAFVPLAYVPLKMLLFG